MSRSTDAGHFFQTTSALETEQRKALKSKNRNGQPITVPSKILAVIPDSTSDGAGCVFIAESAGTARRLDIQSAETANDHKDTQPSQKATRKIYRGPTAPLTSLAISPDQTTLVAGCWDKSVWSWDIATGQPKRKYTGHSDFVKSVLCASLASPRDVAQNSSNSAEQPCLDILISGSADSSVIIWSLTTGQKLQTIRGGERASGILDLAIDPASLQYPKGQHPSSTSARKQIPKSFTLYAASSDPKIRRWSVYAVQAPAGEQHPIGVKITEAGEPICEHETSVNSLCFWHGDDDEDQAYDENNNGYDPSNYTNANASLVTASSDNTAKHLLRGTVRRPQRRTNEKATHPNTHVPAAADDGTTWVSACTFQHPDFVRAAIVYPIPPARQTRPLAVLITACRDEEVRVFEMGGGDEDRFGALVCVFRGHFEEVTSLALLRLDVDGDEGGKRQRDFVVSVSIDGTVRRWSLDWDGMLAVGVEGKSGLGEEDVEDGKEVKKLSLMTAEEEAELEALLDSDDD